MHLRKRLDELERRVRELEQRPIVYPPVFVPTTNYPPSKSPPVWYRETGGTGGSPEPDPTPEHLLRQGYRSGKCGGELK